MIFKRLVYLFLFAIFIGIPFLTNAQNPIIQTVYTADPAPLVYKDTVFYILVMTKINLLGLP